MASIITAQLDLDKIPRDKINEFDRRDGSKGKSIYVTISVNDETKFGNNTSISVGQTKEERDAKAPKTYLGNGKVVWTDGTITVAERDDEPQMATVQQEEEALPF